MYHPTLSSPVTRRIWGSPDAILLFFAGGAAEFAAIKAVDWLFFTGRLPNAPIERLFETVWFAQQVFLGVPNRATKTIEEINRIHRHLEGARGQEIPQWAYRDVLFILIDYGERAHEVVYGPMSEEERICHLEAALALGRAMDLSGLPTTYAEYEAQRHRQLLEDYERSPLTDELYTRYRASLGRGVFGCCGLCKPACCRLNCDKSWGSSRTGSSTGYCGSTITCPAAATSCALCGACCCRAGTPGGWAR